MSNNSCPDPHELAAEYDMFYRLCEKIADRVNVTEQVAQAVVLQLACDYPNDSSTDRRSTLNIGIVAGAGQRISRFLADVASIAPQAVQLNGTSTSYGGAIGSTQHGSLDPGPLLDDGVEYVYIESATSLSSKTQRAFEQILETGHYSIAKADVNETVSAPGSICLTETVVLDKYVAISDQLPFKPTTLMSLDLVVATPPRNAGYDFQRIGSVSTLDIDIVREYLEYVHDHGPTPGIDSFDDESRRLLLDFDHEYNRKAESEDGCFPDSIIDTAIRLSHAHARVNLKSEITAESVEVAIELLKDSLTHLGLNLDSNESEFDAEIVEAGTCQRQRDRIKDIKQLIIDISEDHDHNSAPVEEVLERAQEIGMDVSKAEHEIEKLKQKGEVYHPPNTSLPADIETLRTT